ncbi:MAG: DNA replication and repair protein RecF [Chloroflexi bacterium B3_Chlor]|nr:MAG: DNA replication and repair protein RecF [Chloroflexi bacterium B3_Chlor]
MHLTHLSLTNFRNYARLDLDFSNSITLLQGDNAQGKTNLLEAVYYLATANSPRAHTHRELINWLANEDQMPFARLEAKVEGTDALREVNIVLLKTADRLQKEIKINGVKRRVRDLIGQLKAVLFMPEDIDLIAGSPEARRRYLDTAICQIDRRYYQSLQEYSRVLTQRNSLLRRLREHPADPHQLDFWDQRLVEEGSRLIAGRLETVMELDRLLQDIHPRLTGGEERLRLLYRSRLPLEGKDRPEVYNQLPLDVSSPAGAMIGTDALSSLDVKAIFQQQLKVRQKEEIERGMTLMGPHRDDLRFLVGGVDMCTYGSRGQQRTIAISLKLAEMELIRSQTGEEPILLLDDVMSELDEERRQCLMDAINKEQQVIITATRLDCFAPSFLDQATVWAIRGGRIENLSP